MLVSIHQPHYLPWLRYLDKIARSDLFILLDDVQYEKNGFQNRNKIKTAQGWAYLTVPVQKPTYRTSRETEIDNRTGWRDKHRRALEMNYRKAPYFERYWPEWSTLYAQEWTHLAALNRAMLMLLLQQLKIATPVVFSSDLPTQGRATERLAELCSAVGGDSYLSGRYAVETYLDPAILSAAGIRLAFQEWHAPTYRQLHPAAGFVSDLAIVDLLFNAGPCAREILRGAGSTTWADGAANRPRPLPAALALQP
jgi:WbqC-like protein